MIHWEGHLKSPEYKKSTHIAHIAILCALLMSAGVMDLLANPVQESLKESPWYEHEDDDYYHYTPEDIRIPERRQEREIERQERGNRQERAQREPRIVDGPGAISLGGSFMQVGLFIIVGLLVAVVLTFIVLVIRERRGLSQDLINQAHEISHSDLPDVLIEKTGATGPLTRDALVESIESALKRGDFKMAVIFIYLYTLLRLQAMGLIKIHKNYTAREYLRLLNRKETEAGRVELQPIVGQVVRNFEFALYRGNLPVDHNVPMIWQELRQRLV